MSQLDCHNVEEVFQCQDCKAIYFKEHLGRIILDKVAITFCRGCNCKDIRPIKTEEEK
jgi:hypothetical protein